MFGSSRHESAWWPAFRVAMRTVTAMHRILSDLTGYLAERARVIEAFAAEQAMFGELDRKQANPAPIRLGGQQTTAGCSGSNSSATAEDA